LTVDPGGNLTFWSRDHLTGKVHEGEDDRARNLFFSWAPWVASAHRNVPDDAIQGAQTAHAPEPALRANAAVT
jgi:hypothetical protein